MNRMKEQKQQNEDDRTMNQNKKFEMISLYDVHVGGGGGGGKFGMAMLCGFGIATGGGGGKLGGGGGKCGSCGGNAPIGGNGAIARGNVPDLRSAGCPGTGDGGGGKLEIGGAPMEPVECEELVEWNEEPRLSDGVDGAVIPPSMCRLMRTTQLLWPRSLAMSNAVRPSLSVSMALAPAANIKRTPSSLPL